jgi:hypothetical protein
MRLKFFNQKQKKNNQAEIIIGHITSYQSWWWLIKNINRLIDFTRKLI